MRHHGICGCDRWSTLTATCEACGICSSGRSRRVGLSRPYVLTPLWRGIRDGTNVFISGTLFAWRMCITSMMLAPAWRGGVRFTYTSLFGAYSSYYSSAPASSMARSSPTRFATHRAARLRRPEHPHQRVLTAAFLLVLGRSSWSPWMPSIVHLFHSMLWDERV